MVLVEDSALLREVIVDMLSSISDVKVVSQAEGQAEALAEIQKHRPKMVIVDLELAQGNGLGVLQALKSEPARYGDPIRIVYTNHTSPTLKQRCSELDIGGFFDKSYQFDELMSFVQNAAAEG